MGNTVSRFIGTLKLERREWQGFFVLWIGCIVGNLALLPYIINIVIGSTANPQAIILSALLNSLIIYPFPIYIGMRLKRKLSLAGLPLIEGIKRVNFPDILKWGVLTGIISWLLIKAGDWGFSFLTPQLLDLATTHPPILMGFLASFYGGIVEEVTLRFFLMALFLWPLKKYGSVGVWVAILLAAVVFGIGHLPATVQVLGLHSMVDLPILVVSRALILNGIVGVICGWLYWRKGLEYAIISHFTADLGVHILSPLLG